ncbi:13020_t:CDS:2 [Entrophospora sp. SA101]|nr:13020_t:CDS:2 [Entrophospora sp. SA101]
MPKAKNLGPCVIPECNYENTCRFRKMTKLAIEKVKNKHPEGSYNFIEEGNELCHEHYMKIVESDIHEKYKNKSLNKNVEEKREEGRGSNIVNAETGLNVLTVYHNKRIIDYTENFIKDTDFNEHTKNLKWQ